MSGSSSEVSAGTIGHPCPRFRTGNQIEHEGMDGSHPIPDPSRADLHRRAAGVLSPPSIHPGEQVQTTDRAKRFDQEFILLSDVIGLSLLVDSIDHPKPPASTEGTVLGPFHTHEAEDEPNGGTISHDPDGEACLVLCTVKDTAGKPIQGVKIDIWETDSKGFYDVQYADRKGPDGRAVMKSDAEGAFWFKAIVPVPYPIPHDGPVGKLLKKLKRHPYRPSHMHFMFEKEGYDHLITYVHGPGPQRAELRKEAHSVN